MTLRFDLLATHAAARGAALASMDMATGRRWNYAELDRDVNRVAAWLVERLGPASGARVATIARNSVNLLILHFACIRAGAIFVPFNWRLALPELAALAADAQPAMLFHDADFAVPDGPQENHVLAALEGLTEKAPAVPPAAARRGTDAPATLLYTSGTSGKPKGVIVTEQNVFWGCTGFVLGNDVTTHSVMLCDMPMFHTVGLFAAARSVLLAGGVALISPGFDAAKTLARIADPALRITHYFSVPQMAQMMWQSPGFDPAMLRGLTVYAMGGAPNPGPQIERFVRAGIKMSDGFGMSETCSVSGMPVGDPDLLIAKAGSCGKLYAFTEARIVDDAGADVPDGKAGELWLRGPNITPGYWNQPALTEAAFTAGWFRTGDAAIRDADGYYFLVDRKKDMFISGGENVYPAEVEAALAGLEGVAEAAVVGVPDERWGEVGRAYVTTAPGFVLTETDVLAHCRKRLARFKVPASVVINRAIPRTATGKIQKHILKAQAAAELVDDGGTA